MSDEAKAADLRTVLAYESGVAAERERIARWLEREAEEYWKLMGEGSFVGNVLYSKFRDAAAKIRKGD